MIKIDLITGFLGSGKTTFIRKYAKHFLDKGKKICILENDFGAVNVDRMLLQDLMSDNCEIEMVSAAYDKDCHKRRFKTKLISMGMQGFDRVIVEPSGIYDIDEFFDVIREEPLDRWFEIGSVICIADAGLDRDMSETADFLFASQLANAGKIVLSKCQLFDEQEVEKTVAHIKSVMNRLNISGDIDGKILCKDWDKFTDEDIESIAESGYELGAYEKKWIDEGKAFSSLYFMNIRMPIDVFEEKARKLIEDGSCGNIFRIKGFMPAEDGKWAELNAVRSSGHTNITVKPIENGQEVFIVIGEDLDEKAIKDYWESK